MKTHFTIIMSLMLALLVVATVVLVLSENPALAVVNCPTTSTADSDGDGLTDAQECAGGISFGGITHNFCAGGPREQCLDPNSKDVFIYVKKASPSLLDDTSKNTTTALFPDLIQARDAAGTGMVAGLNLGVHAAFVTTNPADRSIVAGGIATLQKAILLVEDKSPSSIFGQCVVGTPTNTGTGTIYTQAIKDNVNFLMGTDSPNQYGRYFQHTFTHETGHCMALTAKKDRKIGYHYASSPPVLMSESVTFASATKTFTFPTAFATGDVPCLQRVDASNPLNCLALVP